MFGPVEAKLGVVSNEWFAKICVKSTKVIDYTFAQYYFKNKFTRLDGFLITLTPYNSVCGTRRLQLWSDSTLCICETVQRARSLKIVCRFHFEGELPPSLLVTRSAYVMKSAQKKKTEVKDDTLVEAPFRNRGRFGGKMNVLTEPKCGTSRRRKSRVIFSQCACALRCVFVCHTSTMTTTAKTKTTRVCFHPSASGQTTCELGKAFRNGVQDVWDEWL